MAPTFLLTFELALQKGSKQYDNQSSIGGKLHSTLSKIFKPASFFFQPVHKHLSHVKLIATYSIAQTQSKFDYARFNYTRLK